MESGSAPRSCRVISSNSCCRLLMAATSVGLLLQAIRFETAASPGLLPKREHVIVVGDRHFVNLYRHTLTWTAHVEHGLHQLFTPVLVIPFFPELSYSEQDPLEHGLWPGWASRNVNVYRHDFVNAS